MMACLLKSCATTTTTAPSFYTNYLQQLATCGAAAARAANYICASPLQSKAFANVGANVGNYKSALCAAGANIGAAGATCIAKTPCTYLQNAATSGLTSAAPYLAGATTCLATEAQGYMNPYVQCVVKSIGTLGQMNLQQNLAPGATAGAVGSGQFGSQRGAQVLAQTMRDANNQILAQQNQALQCGYKSALCAAKAQNQISQAAGQTAGTLTNQYNVNQVAAGQTAEQAAAAQAANQLAAGTGQMNLAGQTQGLGLACVNALATLGCQQRTIAQNKQLFPLQLLGTEASLLSGAQIPMSTTSTATGSPLSAIAGLGSLATGLFTGKCCNTPFSNIVKSLSSSTVPNNLAANTASNASVTAPDNTGTSAGQNADLSVISKDTGIPQGGVSVNSDQWGTCCARGGHVTKQRYYQRMKARG
jgi:hypothetical protein